MFCLLDSAGQTQTLHTTDEHPFYVLARGWTKAKGLRPDDLLQRPDGSATSVLANAREAQPGGANVYNLRIPATHSYFVRAEGSVAEPVWVHNAGRGYGPGAYRKANPQYDSPEWEIHHSVEWNTLDRYPGAFSAEELNLDAMMRPMMRELRMDGQAVHRSIIRMSWDGFSNTFAARFNSGEISVDKMRQLILRHRDFVDRMYLGR